MNRSTHRPSELIAWIAHVTRAAAASTNQCVRVKTKESRGRKVVPPSASSLDFLGQLAGRLPSFKLRAADVKQSGCVMALQIDPSCGAVQPEPVEELTDRLAGRSTGGRGGVASYTGLLPPAASMQHKLGRTVCLHLSVGFFTRDMRLSTDVSTDSSPFSSSRCAKSHVLKRINSVL